MAYIYKCRNCNKYTLDNICESCGIKTVRPLPPNLKEKYGKYRRLYKEGVYDDN